MRPAKGMCVVRTSIVFIKTKARRFDGREGGNSGGEGCGVRSTSTVEWSHFTHGIAVSVDPPEYIVFQRLPLNLTPSCVEHLLGYQRVMSKPWS